MEGFVTSRRGARTVALQVLYEVDSVGHPWEEVCHRCLDEKRLSPEAASFARDLVKGVLANRERLDDIISEFAPSWPVAQLLAVDRNLLRLAIYELTIDRAAPPKVVINETVEMAKLFGSESSFKFVNGVLGAVMRAAKL
ncbi:MAG: nusB [Dehalococcoidia bacterium]|nr:nusB [Dehalococcoidia bacterium]